MPWSQKELEKALILLINAPADSVSAKAVLMRCWGIHCLSHQHQRRALLVRPCERWPFRGGLAEKQRSSQTRSWLPAPGFVDDLCVVFKTPAPRLSVSCPLHLVQAQSPEKEPFQPGPQTSLPPSLWASGTRPSERPSPGLRPLTLMRVLGTREPFHVKPTHVAPGPRVGSP